MNNDIENIDKTDNLTIQEVFTEIWTKPRYVFKFINDTHYEKYMTLLLVLAGISRAFDRASTNNFGDNLPLWAILGVCIILGGLLGWVSYYIFAALISWTGSWLGGKGDSTSILRVIAYAMVPSILGLLMLIPQIGIYGVEMFKAGGDIASAGLILNILFYGTMYIEFILAIWTIVLFIVGVSEVQEFSILKSILNLLLPILLFVVPMILLVLIINIL